jgi:hypothetical protein
MTPVGGARGVRVRGCQRKRRRKFGIFFARSTASERWDCRWGWSGQWKEGGWEGGRRGREGGEGRRRKRLASWVGCQHSKKLTCFFSRHANPSPLLPPPPLLPPAFLSACGYACLDRGSQRTCTLTRRSDSTPASSISRMVYTWCAHGVHIHVFSLSLPRTPPLREGTWCADSCPAHASAGTTIRSLGRRGSTAAHAPGARASAAGKQNILLVIIYYITINFYILPNVNQHFIGPSRVRGTLRTAAGADGCGA